MKISTRGRYALRVLVDLAEHRNEEYVPLKEIALREDIPFKYVESIMTTLSKEELVIGKHGKNGGYRLVKEPSEYKVSEILKITEGDLAPVSCLGCEINNCKRNESCKTLPMWKNLQTLITDYFDSISIATLMTNSETYLFGSGI